MARETLTTDDLLFVAFNSRVIAVDRLDGTEVPAPEALAFQRHTSVPSRRSTAITRLLNATKRRSSVVRVSRGMQEAYRPQGRDCISPAIGSIR